MGFGLLHVYERRGKVFANAAESGSHNPALGDAGSARSRRVRPQLANWFRAGYLLTSLTARARPGSVEASRCRFANRLPTGVMGVAR
jgi:hypothetical protein